MYEDYVNGITDGRQHFPKWWIAGENSLYIGSWLVAAALLWPLWRPSGIPVAALAWLLLVAVVQILLKKHNCAGCYYYGKWCHLGWGKLSAALFEQDSGNRKTGLALSLFYVLCPPLVLAAALLVAFVRGAGLVYWTMIAAYVLLNAATFPIRKKGCAECAMRKVCQGSAAKA